ncbi:MAG: glutamate-cysteine ligase family protein [Sumerlaeia bacterium]
MTEHRPPADEKTSPFAPEASRAAADPATAPDPDGPLRLFEGFGVELEYMIVRRDSLNVAPICDELMARAGSSDEVESEISVENGIAWSNELVLHVLEMKTDGPAPTLNRLADHFQASVKKANGMLEGLGACLMPGAMHPWMDPLKETKLWPHENTDVYRTFDRIFDCKGHGWSNLQSTHINLPFQGPEEFGRLHAAVRLILPLIPALAASSPIFGGHVTTRLDNRLDAYRNNCRRIPSVTGAVIPEPIFDPETYRRDILKQMWSDVSPLDPEGVLRHEWLNARGAIARFTRGSIEIRIMDIQECPKADLAIVNAIVGAIWCLVEENLCPYEDQKTISTGVLADVLMRAIDAGPKALVFNPGYLSVLGCRDRTLWTLEDIWAHLLEFAGLDIDENASGIDAGTTAVLRHIHRRGPLATRILRAVGKTPAAEHIRDVYRELCLCLDEGRIFDA